MFSTLKKIASERIENGQQDPDYFTAEATAKSVIEYPALEGSEKQISWAEKIRANYDSDNRTIFALVCLRLRNKGFKTSSLTEYVSEEKFLQMIQSATQEKKAGWWINNRESIVISVAERVFCNVMDVINSKIQE